MDAGPHGINVARLRSRIRSKDLWTCILISNILASVSVCVHLSWVGLSLDDVENTNVAAGFTGSGGDHSILWLQQSSHDIKHSSLTNSFGLPNTITREWGIRGHEEVTSRGRYQGRDDPNQIIVHVARVAKRCSAGRHNRRYLIQLSSLSLDLCPRRLTN